MIRFPSDFSSEELTERWDEYTSPARFAGSDDTMDLIFVAKRKNNKIKLVRRARTVSELFTCVFRGEIKRTGQGSEIKGHFTKSYFDYLICAIALGLLFYIRSFVIERGTSLGAMNTILIAAIIGGILLLSNFRPTKRKYAEFICKITDKDTKMFLSRSESREEKSGQSE